MDGAEVHANVILNTLLRRMVRVEVEFRHSGANACAPSSCPEIGVGDRPWHKGLTYAAKPIFTAPMRYFDAARDAEAVDWVSGIGALSR
jgi:hypothetical protein